MSYIIKNNTQGAIVARLTDAGRKKLSEGKLNIGLFQIGDSEICYDCYTQLPSQFSSLNMLQAEHNAHNLTASPHKNKGHIKYPLSNGISSGDTFGPTIAQHTNQPVFNTATPRGFFDIPKEVSPGNYNSFSAKTGSAYTLSSDWRFCVSGATGTTTMDIFSATTSCSAQRYSPVTGDLISVTYEFSPHTNCSELFNTAMSQTLFYQVTGGNANAAQTSPGLSLTVDRNVPNFSGHSAYCATVRVYPAISGKPMINSSIYSDNTTVSYWCDDTLSFNSCCDISTDDTKIWNLNINWTESVAGITATYEDVDGYGSSGYCGSKEYFGYNSNDGQYFSDQQIDQHNEDEKGGTWHVDSNSEKRVVLPEDQKCIGIIHYTNNTTTDFYGEKFALEDDTVSDIGEARNFKIHMPWLMWHKNPGTTLGQTFYVDPVHVGGGLFPSLGMPHYMESNINDNMNHDGLRYYYLTDDNVVGDSVNPVAKVFPDYKMVIIDDEELLAAMSYKSNRTYTLPSPYTNTIPAGSSCSATTCLYGEGAMNNSRIWVTYMLQDSITTGTTGIHCNYYVFEDHNPSDLSVDIAVKFGKDFPYLNNGFTANRLLILFQVTMIGVRPDPALWKYIDVTSDIPNHVVGANITEDNITSGTYHITGQDTALCSGTSASGYTLNDFITVATIDTQLQFGDEYFFYGSLETDIMATIYEMRHVVQLGSNKFTTSNNPTWIDYKAVNAGSVICPKVTEIGLYDNEFGTPDLMAIAKLQSPIDRACGNAAQQFTITIDF